MAPFLDPSTVVTVVGTTRQELNGKTGKVVVYDSLRCRYVVKVDGQERTLAFLPNNIVKCETANKNSCMSDDKQCVVCSERIKTGTAPPPVVLPACAHVFCCKCPRHLHDSQACISCQMADPTIDDLKKLVYIQNLFDPPQSLLETILDEYTCTRNLAVVESIATKHKNEIQVLENEKALKAKEAKEKMRLLKDRLGKGKTQKQLKDALRNSHPYKAAKDELEALDPLYDKKRKELEARQQTRWNCRALPHRTAQELEPILEQKRETTKKAIEKWYRQASRRCHPDRVGEEHQDTFDELVKAKETLCNDKLGPKYIKDMLDVLFQIGHVMLKLSHVTWVGTYQPHLVDNNKKSDAGEKTVYAIEGGIRHLQPRKAAVSVIREKSRLVRVYLPFPTHYYRYQFFQYCKVIHVFAEQADDVEATEIHVAKITDEKLANARDRSDLEVTLTLPHSGIWDIRWCFTMIIEGVTRNSPRSEDARVDLLSDQQRRMRESLRSFEALARKRASNIHTVLLKLKTSRSLSPSEMEQLYESLAGAVMKARDTEFHLQKAVGACGETSSDALGALQDAIEQTNEPRSKLEGTVAFHTRKAGLKSFKAKIYNIIQCGQMEGFLCRVTDDVLAEMQGDTNRLYQLLIEAKKGNSVELVDAFTLEAAVRRNDLFSAKQLEALAKRRDEVEAMVVKEAERAKIEAKKQNEVEENRRELEARASESGIDRGEIVEIHGLKNQPELNGSLAIFMGLGNGNRYNVRLYGGDREVTLLKENFRRWEEQVVVSNPGPTETGVRRGALESAPRTPQKKQEQPEQVSSPQQEEDNDGNKKQRRCHFGSNCHHLKNGFCKYPHPPEGPSCVSTSRDAEEPTAEAKDGDEVPTAPVTPSPGRATSTSPAESEAGSALLSFLRTQKACLKCAPERFLQWLHNEDISSLSDLVEACDDDDYWKQLISNGLKKFKRDSFQKAAAAAAAAAVDAGCVQASHSIPRLGDDQIPHELICPITHAPFVDPVVAGDGCCYERKAIEEWFAKQQAQINDACEELRITSDSERANAIIARGVRAPSGQKLENTTLIPNRNAMILARQYTEGSSGLLRN